MFSLEIDVVKACIARRVCRSNKVEQLRQRESSAAHVSTVFVGKVNIQPQIIRLIDRVSAYSVPD